MDTMSTKRAAEILRLHASVRSDGGTVPAAMRIGAEAIELLEWYGRNPHAIGWALDRSTGDGNWTWRDASKARRSTDASDLPDAIRKAKKASEDAS